MRASRTLSREYRFWYRSMEITDPNYEANFLLASLCKRWTKRALKQFATLLPMVSISRRKISQYGFAAAAKEIPIGGCFEGISWEAGAHSLP